MLVKIQADFINGHDFCRLNSDSDSHIVCIIEIREVKNKESSYFKFLFL